MVSGFVKSAAGKLSSVLFGLFW